MNHETLILESDRYNPAAIELYQTLGQVTLLDCAVEQFQKTLDINSNNLGALAGMAEVLFYKNEKVSAKEYYNKASQISSQYKPLLKLKKKMN